MTDSGPGPVVGVTLPSPLLLTIVSSNLFPVFVRRRMRLARPGQSFVNLAKSAPMRQTRDQARETREDMRS